MTRAELIEALKSAKGPDRELDAEIWLHFTPGTTRKKWSYAHAASGKTCEVDETRDETRRLIVVPSFTASLDAAISLVERVRPGVNRRSGFDPDMGYWANLKIGSRQHVHSGATESISLLIALLESLEAEPV